MKVKIQSENGLHARPASQIVAACSKFESEIFVVFEGNEANARSIMNLLGLGIKYADEVEVKAEGVDAKEAEMEISEILGAAHA